MALALSDQGDVQDAADLCASLTRRYGSYEELPLASLAARALGQLGVLRARMGDHAGAEQSFAVLVARHGSRFERPLAEQVAAAAFNRALSLARLGCGEEEMDCYRFLMDSYLHRDELDIAEPVIKGMMNLGAELVGRSHYEEAVTVFDRLVARFQRRPEEVFGPIVCGARFNAAVVRSTLHQQGQALAGYRGVINIYENHTDPQVQVQVARARVNLGLLLHETGAEDEGLEILGDLARRYDQQDMTPELAEVVAGGLLRRAGRLAAAGLVDAALEAYDDLVRVCGHHADPDVMAVVTEGLFESGMALIGWGRVPRALESFDLLLALCDGDTPGPRALHWVAKARSVRAQLQDPTRREEREPPATDSPGAGLLAGFRRLFRQG
ncbi:MAG: tetratricopeptide repeat protein [Magnetococcus sp. WYHC-3]